MTKPITPEEVGAAKARNFPPEVFEAFNVEIAAKFTSGSAHITQVAVVERLVLAGFTCSDIFDKGYLNVEEAYSDAGWKVTYSKPAYNDGGEAYFVFRKA